MQLFAVGQSIANLKDSIIGQADDITRIGFINGAFALRHKLRGRTESYGFA